jgi:hypothetical protein
MGRVLPAFSIAPSEGALRFSVFAAKFWGEGVRKGSRFDFRQNRTPIRGDECSLACSFRRSIEGRDHRSFP